MPSVPAYVLFSGEGDLVLSAPTWHPVAHRRGWSGRNNAWRTCRWRWRTKRSTASLSAPGPPPGTMAGKHAARIRGVRGMFRRLTEECRTILKSMEPWYRFPVPPYILEKAMGFLYISFTTTMIRLNSNVFPSKFYFIVFLNLIFLETGAVEMQKVLFPLRLRLSNKKDIMSKISRTSKSNKGQKILVN